MPWKGSRVMEQRIGFVAGALKAEVRQGNRKRNGENQSLACTRKGIMNCNASVDNLHREPPLQKSERWK